ncbi:putative RNA-directed DNA polymerase from transposon BS [Trichonephila clavipes]|nr:putative RNA-directed DNA polymerase from transposon BS [Trichonephila clavipes]
MEIRTGSADSNSSRYKSSNSESVQRRSKESQHGRKKGSGAKRELEEKGISFLRKIIHRPISLLPVLSKLAERIILNRLNNHLQINNILIPQQHGFRANLSTSHQLLRVVEYVKTGFAENKSTGAVFLDIHKAFDRVWHCGLLCTLISALTPPT